MQTELNRYTTVPENGRLLRRTLQVNGTVSGICALLFLLAAPPLSAWTGIPSTLLVVVGLGFLPFVAFVFYTARQSEMNPTYGRIILVLDIAWVLMSVLVLWARWLPLTTAGKWAVALAAELVAIFAILEYVGLRRYQAG